MMAVQHGNVEAVQVLLEQGAQPADTDSAGRTALDFAETFLAGEDPRNDKDRIVRLLKQKWPKAQMNSARRQQVSGRNSR